MDFTTIPWQPIAELTLIVLCSLFFLVIMALPIISISGQTLSLIRQRSAYAKCAKQITLLALFLGWTITLASLYPLWLRVSPPLLALIAQVAVDGQPINYLGLWEPIKASAYLQAHVYGVGLLLAASILLSIFYARWSAWKNNRILLQSHAIFAACWYAMAFYSTLCILQADEALTLGIAHPLTLNAFFMPSFDANFWSILPYIPPLSFALAGGFACVWLILRRNKDDFGRDYYAQMLPWCAVWARNAWLVFWLILLALTGVQWITLLQQENYLQNPEFIRSVAFVLLWLIPGILWAIAIKSAHPLRHKATLILAFILGTCSIVPLYQAL